MGQNIDQKGKNANHREEDHPENRWPVLHNLPIESELLEDALVEMRELQPDQIAECPNLPVVMKDLRPCKDGAAVTLTLFTV